jgi:hypothetical protein
MKNIISHQHVLSKIKEAIVAEELAVPLYTSHIKQIFFWSGLSKEKQEKIISGLQILEKDSINHIKLLKQVKKIYLKNSKN